jgi:hypothetical protein
VEYARLHEAELREQAIDEATLYLANCSFDDLLEKFYEGCEEHGAIDPLHNFTEEAVDESRDMFWYAAIRAYLLSIPSNP